ncbi:MAG: hypothetical protein U1A77_01265 [Pirellulales bacterium]
MAATWLLVIGLTLSQTNDSATAQGATTDNKNSVATQAKEKAPTQGDQKAAESKAKTPAELKATVARLVRQLDDNQLAKRETAEQELIGLGPSILEMLPNITRQTPAEVKERLTRVRRRLETALAESATRPARVTLKGPLSLAAALASLEKQTGNRLLDYRAEFNQEAREVEITGDFQDKPFWEVLDAILDQGDLTTYAFSGQRGTVAIVARDEGEVDRAGRGSYSGMFRFEGTRAEAVRDLRSPQNHSLRMFLDVSWEPRLQPIVITQALSELTVLDDKGEKLEIDGREGEIEVPVDGDTSGTEMYIPLQLPDRTVRKIGSLRGKLQVLAPGRIETFEFTDLEKAKAVEHRRAAVTVTLDQVRKNQELFEVRMRIKFDAAANALESHRDWIYQNPAFLIDAEGEKVDNVGMEATLQEEDQVGVSYQFVVPDGLKGYKFQYTTPVAVIKLPVEFELKDIELP